MKANSSKLQFVVLGVVNIAPLNLNVTSRIIPCSSEVKLLGINTDNQLKFNKHIDNLFKKASFKLYTLWRIKRYLTAEKVRLLANAFIDSQLIWMFAGKILINKFCKIHQRTLQVVYNECNESYEKLLQLINNASIHQRYLRYLALEVFNHLCI